MVSNEEIAERVRILAGWPAVIGRTVLHGEAREVLFGLRKRRTAGGHRPSRVRPVSTRTARALIPHDARKESGEGWAGIQARMYRKTAP
jgi:hypothetical protein